MKNQLRETDLKKTHTKAASKENRKRKRKEKETKRKKIRKEEKGTLLSQYAFLGRSMVALNSEF